MLIRVRGSLLNKAERLMLKAERLLAIKQETYFPKLYKRAAYEKNRRLCILYLPSAFSLRP